MQGTLKSVLYWIVILIISLPLAGILTLALVPFWRWLEANTGMEAIGHSGPAEWCYALVYGLLLVLIGLCKSGRAKQVKQS